MANEPGRKLVLQTDGSFFVRMHETGNLWEVVRTSDPTLGRTFASMKDILEYIGDLPPEARRMLWKHKLKVLLLAKNTGPAYRGNRSFRLLEP